MQTLGKLGEAQLLFTILGEMALMFSVCSLVTGEEPPTLELDEVAPFLPISQNRKTKAWRKVAILNGYVEGGINVEMKNVGSKAKAQTHSTSCPRQKPIVNHTGS